MDKKPPAINNRLAITIPDKTYERVVSMLINMASTRQDKVNKYKSKTSRGVKGHV